MSILIKGMEMPKNCEKCKFSWMDTDHHWYCDANKPWGLDVTDCISDRHVDCPLAEIPDGHGRLIDADALIPKFVHGHFDDMYVPELEINLAPTIIPAEVDA